MLLVINGWHLIILIYLFIQFRVVVRLNRISSAHCSECGACVAHSEFRSRTHRLIFSIIVWFATNGFGEIHMHNFHEIRLR